MNLQEVLVEVRKLLDDTAEPYLWSDEDLLPYANNAVDEACERTRSIQDSTSAVCSVTLVEDTAQYTLDPSIYAVRRVRVEGRVNLVELVNARQLDELHPGWDDEDNARTGTPTHAVFDIDQGTITLYPKPSAAGTLRLSVWRRPLETERMEGGSDEPAVPERMHRGLKHWIAYEALSQADGDQQDPEGAARNLALFERDFGPKPSHHAMRLWSTSRIRGVKPHFV